MARSTQNFRTVIFPVSLLADLQPHAARRGWSANELARILIAVALDENLIDAILDDQVDEEESAAPSKGKGVS